MLSLLLLPRLGFSSAEEDAGLAGKPAGKVDMVGPADWGWGRYAWACLDPASDEGGWAREVGDSWREELDVFRLCIDLLVAMRRRASVPGVMRLPLMGVSPSTTIAVRLWHDIRFANELSPVLYVI